MAEPAKKKRLLKKTETVRERSNKPVKEVKTRRLKTASSQVAKPLRRVRHIGRKEYYLPLPDNKVGRFLNKRRSLIPRFVKESAQEIKLVSWPSRRQTLNFSFAVFVFSLFFGLIVALLDFVLDKLFKALIIN